MLFRDKFRYRALMKTRILRQRLGSSSSASRTNQDGPASNRRNRPYRHLKVQDYHNQKDASQVWSGGGSAILRNYRHS